MSATASQISTKSRPARTALADAINRVASTDVKLRDARAAIFRASALVSKTSEEIQRIATATTRKIEIHSSNVLSAVKAGVEAPTLAADNEVAELRAAQAAAEAQHNAAAKALLQLEAELPSLERSVETEKRKVETAADTVIFSALPTLTRRVSELEEELIASLSILFCLDRFVESGSPEDQSIADCISLERLFAFLNGDVVRSADEHPVTQGWKIVRSTLQQDASAVLPIEAEIARVSI